MASRPGSRFTIGQGMLVVAAFALVMYGVTSPGVLSFAMTYMALAGIVILGLILVIRRVVERNYGIPCPRCSNRRLERRSIVSFGERYYLCPDCGIRCRRSYLMGLLGIAAWEDASGKEFDVCYQKARMVDPWSSPPGLEDEDAIESKTHVKLVRNKRLRTPENPNGPGLE